MEVASSNERFQGRYCAEFNQPVVPAISKQISLQVPIQSSAQVKEYKADLAALKEQMNKAQLALPVGDAARAELVRVSTGR